MVCAKADRPEPREEKVVTNKWSLLLGTAKAANQFFSEYEYKGSAFGIKAEHGAFYRRSENLSWALDLTFVASPSIGSVYVLSMANPAGTNFWSTYDFNAEYGTYYNWNPVENLYLKAGGEFDITYASNMLAPDNINNVAETDLQLQLRMAAGIKYGWIFKNNFGLFLYGDLSVPFFGGFAASARYESYMSSIFKDFVSPEIKHFFVSSFHNYQGIDTEIGLSMDFKTMSLSLSADINNRWWQANGVMNYKKFGFFKIGFSVDLVSRPHIRNRYF